MTADGLRTKQRSLLAACRHVRYLWIHPARIWLAKLVGGEPVRHCMRGYERALRIIDEETAKDAEAVAKEWSA